MRAHKIDDNDITGKKGQTSRTINSKTNNNFKERMANEGKDKSKVKFLLENRGNWTVGSCSEYMNKLSRKEVEQIFRARTRMLKVKENYRGAYNDTTCRACGNHPETQRHILQECPILHPTDTNKVSVEDIFKEDAQHLKTIANKIKITMGKIFET